MPFHYNYMTNSISPTNIATLSELLTLSGSQYRIYDIGRLVTKISKETFEKVELNQLPYPCPAQGHAFIAVAFWQKQSTQPFLWLLKLPLDERGLLNQGARNHFIAIIVEALGNDLTQKTTQKQEQLLNSNPYLFTPAQYKLASLNSKIKVDLNQEPSKYFTDFVSYLSHIKKQGTQWQHIGVQGVTDFIAQINEDKNTQLLINALPFMPLEVLSPVCLALENEQYSVALIDAIIDTLRMKLSTDKESTQYNKSSLLLLRSLAANSQHPHVTDIINAELNHAKIDEQWFITVSGRCWQSLADEGRLMRFFEGLIKTNDLSLFKSIFADLVSIPSIRPIALACIRSEQRSTNLAEAIGQLFRQ